MNVATSCSRRRLLGEAAALAGLGAAGVAGTGCAAGGGPAAPPSQGRPAVTLEYWTRFNQAAAVEVEERRVREFGERFAPARIQTTVTGAEFQEKLDAAFAADAAPDTFSVGNVATIAARGVALVLDRFPQAQREVPDLLELLVNRCKWDGKLQGLPYIADVRAVIYRTDLLRAEGLPAALPDTWEQFRDVTRRLARWDGTALTRAGFNLPKSGNTVHDLFLAVHDSLGQPAFERVEVPKRAQLNGPNGRTALQLMVDLLNRDRVDSYEPPRTAPGSSALVQALQASTWTSAGVVNDARRTNPDQIPNLAVGPIPRFPQAPAPGRRTFFGGSYLMAKKTARHDATAADFLVFLDAAGHAEDISRATSSVPPRKSAADTAYVKDPLIRPFYDATAHGRSNIVHGKSDAIRSVIAREAEAALRQQKGVQPALDDMQRGVQELLDQGA